MKGELATGICVNGAQIVLRLGIATTVLAGAAFVLEGTCGFMTLFCFLLVVSRIYAPFDQCLMLIAELFAAKTASARMRSFYDEPLANGGDSYAPQGHDVVFDDVSFSYGTASRFSPMWASPHAKGRSRRSWDRPAPASRRAPAWRRACGTRRLGA